jgi:transposase
VRFRAAAVVDSMGPLAIPTICLIVSAGDNPDRLRNEAALAQLCGVGPIPASSGRKDRTASTRGGDRAANNALYTIVLCRIRYDPRTRDYVARRAKQGLGKDEIIRCLKRYVVREVHESPNRRLQGPQSA